MQQYKTPIENKYIYFNDYITSIVTRYTKHIQIRQYLQVPFLVKITFISYSDHSFTNQASQPNPFSTTGDICHMFREDRLAPDRTAHIRRLI